MSKKKKYHQEGQKDPDLLNVSDNPGLINFPHHVGSAVIRPEDRGKIKGKAMSAMKEQTERQMSQLYDQMKVLAQQANQIKERVKISEHIYNSLINFEPVIGHIYYLYRRKGEDYVLSMIGPDEWGEDLPYESYQATVRLLSDHTWDVLDSSMDHTRE